VFLDVSQLGCPKPCIALCVLRDANCVIPPLAEGDYAVFINGRSNDTLRVRRSMIGSSVNCSLPAPD
jgi:hypothetical protein